MKDLNASTLLSISFLSAFLSYFICRLIIFISHKKGILDHPNEFRQHDTPTPYFGGVAIFFAFSVAVIILSIIAKDFHFLNFIFLFFPFFLVGLIDDIFKLSSIPKLILIITAALVPNFLIKPSLANHFFLFLCLVFFTNAFNLLDNIDGLCATTAIAFLASLIIYNINDNLLLIIPLFSILGFLLLNKPKAKIFMGDSGSLFLGAICIFFAVVKCNFVNFSNFDFFNYLPLFWLPIYDTFSVIIVRAAAGKSVLIGGKDHFSHRLMLRGLSNSTVIYLLFFITLGAGLTGLFLSPVLSVSLFVFLIAAAATYELLTTKK